MGDVSGSGGHDDHVRDSVPALRVGDAEREAVAGQLREHYAHGRITHDELDNRRGAPSYSPG
jgi:hypothetical protein